MTKLLSLREVQLAGAILVLIAGIAWRFPAFIALQNLANVFNDTAPLIILALGQMVVILTKCIDLSVAATLALCGMVAALLNGMGVPLPVIIMAAIALGSILGAINGTLVWKLQIPPIVVTLGTMTIYRGIIFLISDGKWINARGRPWAGSRWRCVSLGCRNNQAGRWRRPAGRGGNCFS